MTDTKPCSSCGKPVLWIEDQNGTKLPLNTVRVRVYVIDDQLGGWRYAADSEGVPVLRHISHFVTCPNASKHSKKKATP